MTSGAPGPIDLPAPRWERVWASVSRAGAALRILGFVAAVAIVATMAARGWRDVNVRDVAWWLLGPTFAAAVAWWLLLARGWALVSTGHSRRPEIGTWCRTQALRYLPGGIWAPVSRAVIVRGSLLDKLSTVGAESSIALCAALAVGGLGLAAAGHPRWLPLVVAIVVPFLAARLVASRTRITPRRTARATPNYLAGFLAYALAGALAQAAVSGLEQPFAVAGSAAIAWSAGLVVVIAPSGLGVRELVYVAMLSATFPDGELVGAAILLRLVTILAELAVLVVAGRPTLQLRASSAG